MSSYPPSQTSYTSQYYYQPPPTNTLGIAGFVVSLSGMIVCFGITCPVGLILSLIALAKEPRGYAIAGTIIGLLGSVMGAMLMLVVFGFVGGGLPFFSGFMNQSQTYIAISIASQNIDSHYNNHNATLPDEPAGNSLIAGYYDEWSNNLKYIPIQGTTSDYEIISAGPDGQFGNADDISQAFTAYNWAMPATQAGTHGEFDERQIDTAFDAAAKKIIDSFPVGASLPSEEQVNQQTGVLMDAWMTPMKYHPTDNPPIYHLKSAGPDRQWNTVDDITRSFYFAPAGESDDPL